MSGSQRELRCPPARNGGNPPLVRLLPNAGRFRGLSSAQPRAAAASGSPAADRVLSEAARRCGRGLPPRRPRTRDARGQRRRKRARELDLPRSGGRFAAWATTVPFTPASQRPLAGDSLTPTQDSAAQRGDEPGKVSPIVSS